FAQNRLLADSTADAINELKQQVQQLNEKIKILERKQGLEKETTEEERKKTPILSAGADGFTFRSADTNFVVGLHGVLQTDNRTFINDGPIRGDDGFILRRARPIISGTVFRDFDFMFVPDFAPSSTVIQDAYLNYRFAPWLQLQGGKYKVPIGLE